MSEEILKTWIQNRLDLVNERDSMDFVLYYMGSDYYSVKYNFKKINKFDGIYTKELIFGKLDLIHDFIKDL